MSNFGPLATAINDGRAIRNFLEDHCGIFPTCLRNNTATEEISQEFEKLKSIAKSNAKCAFFIHYSGHGEHINGMTEGVTISGSKFPIKSYARKLAMYKNSFVILVLDWCREILQPRGGGKEVMQDNYPGQLYIIHASAPGGRAFSPQDSTMISRTTEGFLKAMTTNLKDTFPKSISDWIPNAEAVVKVNLEIAFTNESVALVDNT